MPITRRSLLLWSSLPLLTLFACSRTSSNASAEPAPPMASVAPQPAKARTITISIKGMTFDPAKVEVAVGDKVTWTNEDLVEHSATADDRTFDSGHIAQKGSWTWTATKQGTFPYTCLLHPTMKGTLVVK